MAMSLGGAKDIDARAQVMAPGGDDDVVDAPTQASVREGDDTLVMGVGAEATSLVPGQLIHDGRNDEEEEKEEDGDAGCDGDSEIEEFHISEVGSWASTAASADDIDDFSEVIPQAVWDALIRPYWSSESSESSHTKTQCFQMPKFMRKLRSKIRVPNLRRAISTGVKHIRKRPEGAAFQP